MTVRPLSAVVLAAGEGTRMRSERPKPLHLLCGRAMLLYVLDALADCSVDRVVIVVGHGAERVTKKLQDEEPDLRLQFVEQRVQRGTGDAVSVGLTGLPDDADAEDDHDVLVLPGDTPLLRPSTVADAREHAPRERRRLHDPHGRARRPDRLRPHRPGQGRPGGPHRRGARRHARGARDHRVEHVDLLLPPRRCWPPRCGGSQPQNAQGEYYLTDVVAVLHDAGYPVATVVARDAGEAAGINDRVQLAEAEAELRQRTNHALAAEGRHDGRPGRDLRRRHRRARPPT